MLERLLDQTYTVRLNSFQTAMQGIRIAGTFTERRGSYCTMSNRCLGEPQWKECSSATAALIMCFVRFLQGFCIVVGFMENICLLIQQICQQKLKVS